MLSAAACFGTPGSGRRSGETGQNMVDAGAPPDDGGMTAEPDGAPGGRGDGGSSVGTPVVFEIVSHSGTGCVDDSAVQEALTAETATYEFSGFALLAEAGDNETKRAHCLFQFRVEVDEGLEVAPSGFALAASVGIPARAQGSIKVRSQFETDPHQVVHRAFAQGGVAGRGDLEGELPAISACSGPRSGVLEVLVTGTLRAAEDNQEQRTMTVEKLVLPRLTAVACQ
jgi:hypothetical protein